MERGIIKVLLDVYLKLMQRLLVYSLNVCFILLNRLVDNILGISLLQDREKLRDQTKYEERSSNWVHTQRVVSRQYHLRCRPPPPPRPRVRLVTISSEEWDSLTPLPVIPAVAARRLHVTPSAVEQQEAGGGHVGGHVGTADSGNLEPEKQRKQSSKSVTLKKSRSVSFPMDAATKQRIKARMLARKVTEWRQLNKCGAEKVEQQDVQIVKSSGNSSGPVDRVVSCRRRQEPECSEWSVARTRGTNNNQSDATCLHEMCNTQHSNNNNTKSAASSLISRAVSGGHKVRDMTIFTRRAAADSAASPRNTRSAERGGGGRSDTSKTEFCSRSLPRPSRSRSAPVAVTLVGQYKAISSGTSDTGDEDEGIGSAESLVSSPELEQQHL